MSKSFTELRKDIAETFVRHTQAIDWFQDQFPEMPTVCDQLQEIDDRNITAYYGAQWGGSLHVSIGNLDTFKADTLLEVLERLEAHFNVEFQGEDQPVSMSKRFTAQVAWEHGNMDISVSANLAYDAKGCTRVQVGVETTVVETPIYRLDCEGEEHGE